MICKLSKGGSPKDHGKLLKLSDGSKGNGIERDMPAFLKKKPATQRKPGITGKLGVSGVPKLDEMLTPATDSAAASGKLGGSGKPSGAGKPLGKPRASASGSKPEAQAASQRRDGGKVVVQMSREWIRINIKTAVSSDVAAEFLVKREKVYSRHLIYTPMWLPATAQHAAASIGGKAGDEASHRDHDVLPNLHYEEAEVRAAVNKKKANLRTKYPRASTLGADT